MNDKTEEAVAAVKALAEMTMIFFDHLLDMGARKDEARAMTCAYIQAMLSSSSGKSSEG